VWWIVDRIRDLAVLSVRRACGFAVIAICTVMAGLLYDPLLAIRVGAFLTTGGLAVLLYKAHEAPRRDHRKTELWLLLGRDAGMPEAVAGKVINNTLRDVYIEHARYAATLALVLWAATLLGRLAA
jgi:hypothetical protein